MSAADRTALDRFFAAFNSGDMPGMEAMLHPDFVITEADSLPYGGVYKGVEGWRALLGKIAQTWTNLVPRVILSLGDGPQFAIMMDLDLVSVATGKSLATRVFEVWTVKDGKIAEVLPFYWDTAAIAAVTGA